MRVSGRMNPYMKYALLIYIANRSTTQIRTLGTDKNINAAVEDIHVQLGAIQLEEGPGHLQTMLIKYHAHHSHQKPDHM